jgi:hypothetical protein
MKKKEKKIPKSYYFKSGMYLRECIQFQKTKDKNHSLKLPNWLKSKSK